MKLFEFKENKLASQTSLLERMESLIASVEGWCTANKAASLYKIASIPEVKMGLEIGIFGGKSFLPVCQALKDKGFGKHYGIEPWSNSVATETPTNQANDDWWNSVDLSLIKRLFFEHLVRLQLVDYAAIIESPSDSAYSLFASRRFHGKIDLLHVDGSHSMQEALHDVTMWTKLVRKGGYVVLDDINWPSVGLAYEYLKTLGTEIERVDEPELGHYSIVQLKD